MSSKKIFLLVLIFSGNISFSQSISRSVVSSGGNFFSNASGSLYSNVGEVITTTLTSINNILTEGFIQPANFIFTSASSLPDAAIISIYPNPASDEIIITSSFNAVIFEIYDIQGRAVILGKSIVKSGNDFLPININFLDPGIYFVKITDKYSNQVVNCRIEKI